MDGVFHNKCKACRLMLLNWLSTHGSMGHANDSAAFVLLHLMNGFSSTNPASHHMAGARGVVVAGGGGGLSPCCYGVIGTTMLHAFAVQHNTYGPYDRQLLVSHGMAASCFPVPFHYVLTASTSLMCRTIDKVQQIRQCVSSILVISNVTRRG